MKKLTVYRVFYQSKFKDFWQKAKAVKFIRTLKGIYCCKKYQQTKSGDKQPKVLQVK